VIHGFLTANGRKIGKSNGNAVSAIPYVEQYGADAVRYYLLRATPPFGDGDFSTERFKSVYAADLVNGLGNLTSRILSLAEKSGIAEAEFPELPQPATDYVAACREYRHDDALASVWRRIDAVNRAIETAKPWEVLKTGNVAPVRMLVLPWLVELAAVARDLAPFLPQTAARIEGRLSSKPLKTPLPLFPRISPPENLRIGVGGPNPPFRRRVSFETPTG
jgi:methionyl-tRNA synthetase